MVASAHYLASQAGVWMLRQGGNAVDAAVCAAATIAVVAPHLNGVGGDLFALVWSDGAQAPVGLNASGRSGSLAGISRLRSQGHEVMPARGPLAVSVPGAVSGWAALLERFGRTRLFDALQPAIEYAENGVPVTQRLAGAIAGNRELICTDAGMTAVFTRNGRPLAERDSFRNPDLAASLAEIAKSDGEAMYRGGLAQRLVDGLRSAGGLLKPEDLAGHSVEWVEPISTTFQRRTVYELPPNTQGVCALELLNLVETSDPSSIGHNTAGYIDGLAKAMRLAYEDRDRYVTDPTFADIPTAMLGSKDYAQRRWREEPAPVSTRDGDTVYLCVVDDRHGAVSLIQSNYMGFGSFVMPAGTGIHLHNRGSYFSLDPDHVNRLEPGKRPMHTLIPAMTALEGQPEIVFGSMGGDAQPQFQLQVLQNHLRFGMSLQEAVEAARFVFVGEKNGPPRIVLEAERFPRETAEQLTLRGYDVDSVEAWSGLMGHAQAIRIVPESSLLEGAADPRGDSAALGF